MDDSSYWIFFYHSCDIGFNIARVAIASWYEHFFHAISHLSKSIVSSSRLYVNLKSFSSVTALRTVMVSKKKYNLSHDFDVVFHGFVSPFYFSSGSLNCSVFDSLRPHVSLFICFNCFVRSFVVCLPDRFLLKLMNLNLI